MGSRIKETLFGDVIFSFFVKILSSLENTFWNSIPQGKENPPVQEIIEKNHSNIVCSGTQHKPALILNHDRVTKKSHRSFVVKRREVFPVTLTCLLASTIRGRWGWEASSSCKCFLATGKSCRLDESTTNTSVMALDM